MITISLLGEPSVHGRQVGSNNKSSWMEPFSGKIIESEVNSE